MTTKPTKRLPGRPSLPPEGRQTGVIRARVLPELCEVYERLGGKAWLVEQLQNARLAGLLSGAEVFRSRQD